VASPAEFARLSEGVTVEMLRQGVRFSDSRDQHVAWVGGDFDAGADRVYVHQTGTSAASQDLFLHELAPALLALP